MSFMLSGRLARIRGLVSGAMDMRSALKLLRHLPAFMFVIDHSLPYEIAASRRLER